MRDKVVKMYGSHNTRQEKSRKTSSFRVREKAQGCLNNRCPTNNKLTKQLKMEMWNPYPSRSVPALPPYYTVSVGKSHKMTVYIMYAYRSGRAHTHIYKNTTYI